MELAPIWLKRRTLDQYEAVGGGAFSKRTCRVEAESMHYVYKASFMGQVHTTSECSIDILKRSFTDL